MRVLLDENLPHPLRYYFASHETLTAAFAGLKNGDLLDAAEAAGVEVLVSGDKTLQYEQNLSGRKIGIVSLSAISWQVIEPHAHSIARAVGEAKAGTFIRIDCGQFTRTRRKNFGPSGI